MLCEGPPGAPVPGMMKDDADVTGTAAAAISGSWGAFTCDVHYGPGTKENHTETAPSLPESWG